MTRNATNFARHNAASPVVYGSALGPDGNPSGCFYRLANDKTFTLSSAECRMVEPRWIFEAAA